VRGMEKVEIKKIERENEENDVDAILAKAVVIQALYAVLDDERNWDIMVVVDDLAGFGKTVISIPRSCLDKKELEKYIQEIKQKKV
jgi:hypothetical protein